jgi:glutaredoxin
MYLSYTYVPPNQLRIHRASAKLLKLKMDDNPYGFSFRFIAVNKEQKDDLNKYVKKSTYTPFIFVHGHKGNVK